MTTEPKKRDPFSDWGTAVGASRDCGELKLVIPIGRDNYFTITADPDTAAMVPVVLRQLLSQPEPEGVGLSDEELDALWFKAVEAPDVVLALGRAGFRWASRQLLKHYTTPHPSPVPVAERLPGPEDVDWLDICKGMLHDFDDLVANSDGVLGLHRNGDLATWDELTEGSDFLWTEQFARAREAIDAQPSPVPEVERLPGPEDCAPWPDDPTISWCWYAREHEEGGWCWRQDSLCDPRAYGYSHWRPHNALPVPGAEVG